MPYARKILLLVTLALTAVLAGGCSIDVAPPECDLISINGIQPLHRSARYDCDKIATLLIKNGAAINLKDFDGNTPLHVAAANNSSRVLKLLLDNGADANVMDEHGQTLLDIAAANNSSRVLKLLLDNAAYINLLDKDGQTLLHIAAANNQVDFAKQLLDKGADANVMDKDGQTPLHFAAWNNAVDTARVLIDNGADINAIEALSTPDQKKYWIRETPLHNAAGNNSIDMVKLLIEKGVNVDVKDSRNQTPLRYAAFLMYGPHDVEHRQSSFEAARLLIELGADVNAYQTFTYALMATSPKVALLLIENGANTDPPDEDNSYLCSAAHLPDIVKVLIDAGANPNQRCSVGSQGLMPLHRAAASSAPFGVSTAAVSVASTKLLIEAGADVNAKDLDGTPILIGTTWNNRTEVARLLIEAGADVNAKDELRDGNSILLSALINQSPDVARLLIEYGADTTGIDLSWMENQ